MLKNLLKTYPLPFFVLVGILLGGLAFYPTPYAHPIWFVTLVLGGAPVVWKTFKGMLRGEFASDIVAMLAIVTAAIMDQAFAGAIVVLMQTGGEALEAYGLRRASFSLDTLLARAPQFALRKEEMEKIPVSEVKVGDILIVKQGDLIPVDGTIVSGNGEIDESAITGEPLTSQKKAEDQVLSGSVDVNGTFEMRADRVSEESQYAKIVALVKRAQEEKAPIQRLADQYAIYFTPLTLIMAALGYFLTKDAHTILSVLVVATPCPLILATPVAVISGINRAAEQGIIVKGGAPIEQIGKADTVVFDKTGTITYGTPHVEKIIGNNILYKAAAVEQLSNHSIAQAIVRKGLGQHGTLPLPTQFKEVPGRGVEAVLDGEEIRIGSKAFIEEAVGPVAEEEGLPVYIAVNRKFAGAIIITDKVRPGVKEMIQKLPSFGVKHTMMLTGDNQKNAEQVAKEAGFETVQAELLPEQKVAAIKELKKTSKKVVMVGDGINDAPALATADVGVAMGAHGTAISAEAADIVLLVDDVTKVSDAILIGQRMLRIAKQSIFVGLGLSFFLMIIAACGYIAPAIGAILQEVIDVVVILNALRAR